MGELGYNAWTETYPGLEKASWAQKATYQAHCRPKAATAEWREANLETFIGFGLLALFSAAGVALTYAGLQLLGRVAGTRCPRCGRRGWPKIESTELGRKPLYRAYPSDRMVHDVDYVVAVRCPHCGHTRTTLENRPEGHPSGGNSPFSTKRRF